MNKVELLKKLQSNSQGNMFSVEITSTNENEKEIYELIKILETEKRIKLREYLQKENSVYIHGIIKYASD
ncbi:hypothetical protein [Neobacillus vireti]|uniref:hypothetical protein n=1 Tax=Neobacillus vireti TaxID=220686 RepID=UPI002FFEDF5E